MKKFLGLAFAAMMVLGGVCQGAANNAAKSAPAPKLNYNFIVQPPMSFADVNKGFATLNKDQKTAELMMGMFANPPAPFATVKKVFAAETLKNFDENAYQNLIKVAADKLGKMKEYKFAAYQNFDKFDSLVYIGTFSKEKVVQMGFAFDKTGKIMNFQFTPVQPAAKK